MDQNSKESYQTSMKYVKVFLLLFADLQEVCSFETFQAQCPSNHVVIMTQAAYGRMNLGECVRADVGYVGCQEDVLRIADSRCSGRQNCEIDIPDAEMDATEPCLAELKMYLEASYACEPGKWKVSVDLAIASWIKKDIIVYHLGSCPVNLYVGA